jgi:hypothetical protein
MCGRKLEAETLALMVLEANMENQETKVTMVVLEIVGCMAEAEYFNYFQAKF